MRRQHFFIAGTDTDVGKTLVATALLEAANQQGLATLGVKPIAAGCEQTAEGLRNTDALLLQQSMSVQLPYEQVNPIALEPAIAPHIAAEQIGKKIRVSQLVGYCRGALMQTADFAVIEGAGGWRVPLNPMETMAGLAKEMNLPVILVVGMKLGCINHALLTAEAIARDGLPLAGWVANSVQTPMTCYQENFETLKTLLRAPCLGEIPFLNDPSAVNASTHLDLSLLLTL